MISFLTRLLDSNNREINRFKPVIEKINSLEENFKKLKDKDFAQKTQEFRQLVKDGAKKRQKNG